MLGEDCLADWSLKPISNPLGLIQLTGQMLPQVLPLGRIWSSALAEYFAA